MDNIQVDFTFAEIMAALAPDPSNPIRLVIDILLYIMFFLNLLAFFMQNEKQIQATMLMGVVLAFNMIAKLAVIPDTHLAMLIINSGIFVIPLIVAGMSKAKRPKPLTVISGVLGGFYFFMFWFFFQRLG